MVRPCVARGFRRSGGFAVLHQCIRPLIGACWAPGHHGYQRACVLINGQASTGPFGSPVFAHARKTDPPFVSSSRRPRRVLGLRHCVLLISRAVPWFEPRAVPSSRPAQRRSRRAQGRSRPAVALGLRRAPALQGCALTDRAEHGARIKWAGRRHCQSSSARSRVLWPAPPRQCGRACWRARSPARCGAAVSWRLRSRI